jgi:predicted dehydrogenase
MDKNNIETDKKISVGIVGFGQRITEIYLPIFDVIDVPVEIVGFVARNKEKGKQIQKSFGIKSFSSSRELVKDMSPDFLIVAVSPLDTFEVVNDLLELHIPLIVETPLAWNKNDVQVLVDKAITLNVKIYVMEQFPTLPLEILKNQIIKAGVLGRIYAAYNDFSTYSYHGIAQLRNYVQGRIVQVKSKVHQFKIDGQHIDQKPEWQLAEFLTEYGETLFFQYSSHYADSPFCFPRLIRLYGEKGSIVGDKLKVISEDTNVVHEISACRENNVLGGLDRLSIAIPGYDPFVWKNPFGENKLTDEQLSVAELLCSIFLGDNGHNKVYSDKEFLKDIEIFQAMSFSEYDDGRIIQLPFSEFKEKLKKLTSRKFLRSKMPF